MKIRVTKQFNFESAHALYNYDGKCKDLHGHSYILNVTIIGTPIDDKQNPKNGMVIDFGDLKKLVNENIVDIFDHSTILNENTEHKKLGDILKREGHKINFIQNQPSCENMVALFADILMDKLPQNTQLHSLKLNETYTSYAEWYYADNI